MGQNGLKLIMDHHLEWLATMITVDLPKAATANQSFKAIGWSSFLPLVKAWQPIITMAKLLKAVVKGKEPWIWEWSDLLPFQVEVAPLIIKVLAWVAPS